MMHCAENTTMKLRDVYYALKHVFETQERCNTCILELGLLLRLKRRQYCQTLLVHASCLIDSVFIDEMNIVPASKGIIFGPFRFSFPSIASVLQQTEQDSACTERWTETTAEAAPEGVLIDSRWVSCVERDIKMEILDEVSMITLLLSLLIIYLSAVSIGCQLHHRRGERGHLPPSRARSIDCTLALSLGCILRYSIVIRILLSFDCVRTTCRIS